MATNIKTVAGRARVAPRRDPYWEKLEGTLHIGWRKMTAGGDTHWIARMLDPANGKRIFKSLGVLAEHPDGERWNIAKREAEAWASHIATGGVTVPKSVSDACEAYVSHLRTVKGNKSADDAQKRFSNYVLEDARFAATELMKLTPAIIGSWHTRLAERPIHRGSRGNRPSVVTNKKRSASSLNRDVTPFRAALNYAFDQGWVVSDFAWRSKLKPIKDADQRRTLYLDRTQRQQLISAAAIDIGNFLRGLSQLPVRPGALAMLKARDFDMRLNQLRITVDKTGPRAITLPTIVANFFTEQCKNKLPNAPIFSRADGSAWSKDKWKDPIKAAVLAAKLPEEASAYTLRHSTITDLVVGGLDLLTIAQISGTSVKMIQEHYGHLRADAATTALAALAI